MTTTQPTTAAAPVPAANDRESLITGEAVLLDLRTALRSLAGSGPGAESSVRKIVGVRHRQDIAEFGLELTGTGGVEFTEQGRKFLMVRCLSIAGGTEQVLLNVVGERILGLPRD